MDFTLESIIAIIGAVLALIVHSSIFGVWIGRLSSKVQSNSNDVQGVADKMQTEIKEIKHNIAAEVDRANEARDAIWKITLDGILEANKSRDTLWKTTLDGILEANRIKEENNREDHNVLFKLVEKVSGKVDNIQDCLHKMQNKKNC